MPFGLAAYDRDGHLIQGVRVPLIITDTSVIQLRDGMVYGLKPGSATIWTQSFGRQGGMGFVVTAPPRITDSPGRQNDASRQTRNKGGSMRYVAGAFCFLLACQQSTRTAAAPPATTRASTVFTDSAIYRVRCKEADSLANLTAIPQKCTPRDQRVMIR